jgi:hypothetical protein
MADDDDHLAHTEPLANRFVSAIAVHSSALLVYDNFAKLRSLNYLRLRSTTPSYGCFHRLTAMHGNSKSAGGNLVGVRPPPGTTIIRLDSMLYGDICVVLVV